MKRTILFHTLITTVLLTSLLGCKTTNSKYETKAFESYHQKQIKLEIAGDDWLKLQYKENYSGQPITRQLILKPNNIGQSVGDLSGDITKNELDNLNDKEAMTALKNAGSGYYFRATIQPITPGKFFVNGIYYRNTTVSFYSKKEKWSGPSLLSTTIRATLAPNGKWISLGHRKTTGTITTPQ